MSRRKKRFWADEEKREIFAQATTPGMSVAQIARRYAVNANLFFQMVEGSAFCARG
jgi:transposase